MVSIIDPVWFSPKVVYAHAYILSQDVDSRQKNSKEFRKVIEASVVAEMLLGLILVENQQYWMQVVSDKEEFPDIRIIRHSNDGDTKFDNYEIGNVEVVEYIEDSGESIIDFILKRKFSQKKSYQDSTIILSYLHKTNRIILPSYDEIKTVIKKTKPQCQIMFVANSDSYGKKTKLIEFNPNPRTLIEYDTVEELQKKDSMRVINFKRGSRKPPQYNSLRKEYPFKNIGFLPNANKRYFNN